jgi:sugar phosphate isomerase/epimerase
VPVPFAQENSFPTTPPTTNRWTADALTLSALTLGRDAGFEERVAAAARAGFVGIGLRAEDYLHAVASGLNDADLQTVLDRYGMVVTEVELLTEWVGAPGRRAKEEAIFHIARTFGVHHLTAALLRRPPPDVVHSFRQLCRRAGPHRVALEFVAFGGLPDPASAWDVINRAGVSNGGLLVDAWHWNRAPAGAKDLRRIPAERIFGVQLSDVGPVPHADLRVEALHYRLPPGEGVGDVAGLVTRLRAAGVTAPLSVEVLSDELLAQGLQATADRVMAAARTVLGGSAAA